MNKAELYLFGDNYFVVEILMMKRLMPHLITQYFQCPQSFETAGRRVQCGAFTEQQEY